MTAAPQPAPPSKLVLTAVLSGGLTCVLSVIYAILCSLALVFRFDCNAASNYTISGSAHLVSTIYRVYFQDGECSSAFTLNELTSDYSVFVLVIITLVASTICLVTAVVLIAAVTTGSYQSISICAYSYIGVCTASLIVDLTFATHFGMDYVHVTRLLNNFSPGIEFNYTQDIIRIGAFLLMTLTLKGFISHVINVVLLILLAVYVVEYSKTIRKHEHSIHKLGVIKAFDPKSRESVGQQQCENCHLNAALASNGSQLNNGYLNDDEPPRNLTRENSRRDDFSTPGFDRSYSWQQAPQYSGRPFSYLEEGKRQTPSRSPSSVAAEPQWRRSPWQGAPPPVPAPDYSPQAPRRLKSALKPAYM